MEWLLILPANDIRQHQVFPISMPSSSFRLIIFDVFLILSRVFSLPLKVLAERLCILLSVSLCGKLSFLALIRR